MMDHPCCRVAVLTPPGRGAVASMVVFGEAALDVVARLFVPATPRMLTQFPVDRIIYGRWESARCDHVNAALPDAPDAPGEELVVVRRDSQSVEVHCHGGAAAVSRILQSLARHGCVRAEAESWLALQSPDRLVAEAVSAVARAATLRTATILLDQVQGSLSRETQSILSCLAQADGQAVDRARRLLTDLLHWAPLGKHLTTPWRIVLVGPANVGKSSLINALLGYQRALVCATPGTTRDVLTDVTAILGWPIELADTAGLRAGGSQIERQGMRLSEQMASSADLVLLVTDLTLPWPAEQQRWVEQLGRPHLLVHNKSDLVENVPADRPAGLLTSATTSAGIDELATTVAETLVPHSPPPRAAVPFSDRHEQTLRDALQALRNGNHEVAVRQLESLLRGKHEDGEP